MNTLRVVFVCSGNICRSPIAAGFARDKLAKRGIPAAVLSCGTLGIAGHPAATFGQMAMEEIGLDISDHYSQGVQPAMLELADWVVVMAPAHETFLRQRIPGIEEKLVRMWEYADEEMPQIADPVGKDLSAFRICRDLLDRCMERWIDSLEEE